MPYGICISEKVLPSEILQGCVIKYERRPFGSLISTFLTTYPRESYSLREVEETFNRHHLSGQRSWETEAALWVHGNMETGQVELHSSKLPQHQGLIFAPLVANIVDAIEAANLRPPSCDNVRKKGSIDYHHLLL